MNKLLPFLIRFRLSILALAGALIILLASQLTVELREPAALNRSIPLARLSEGNSIGQTFITRPEPLQGIRVWLEPPFPSGGSLSLQLRYADLPALALSSVSVPLSTLDADGGVTLSFAPLRAPKSPYVITSSLVLELRVADLPAGEQAIIPGGPDSYPDGTVLIDGVADPEHDLAFEPVYQSRPIDRLWPISQMAAGRPGLFGWPPFYTLLAYSFGCFLVMSILHLWREARQ